jgi:hypothetical protein
MGSPTLESSLAWRKLTQAAEEYCAAVESENLQGAERERKQILRLLNAVERTFGRVPSVLATRADYVRPTSLKERLLLEAFAEAKRLKDAKNVTLISASLAQLYLEEVGDMVLGRKWVDALGKALVDYPDSTESATYLELKAELDGKQ